MKINKIISHIDLGNDPGYKTRDLRVIAKTDKWDHKKLKIFSTAKETISRDHQESRRKSLPITQVIGLCLGCLKATKNKHQNSIIQNNKGSYLKSEYYKDSFTQTKKESW